ncbi:MAG: tetraacyldisaccharide 4'-kinase [Cyclobacteriaceae bacterium]|nr:tetraacyldisaccharide 4'-kinase [Cyclobacteriaceae bacterium]
MNRFLFLLYPFAILYGMVMEIRNFLYDKNIRKSASFDRIIISVGNLSVGGTGKSPMVEYVVRLLKNKYKVATLSRGYKRKTKGYKSATLEDTPDLIGDEPYQFFKKFGNEIVVAVGEERAFAIPFMCAEYPEIEVIVLDDAFQHRVVNRDFSIVTTRYDKLFYKDHLLPVGTLRENPENVKRADVVVVTNSPDTLSDKEMEPIKMAISRYTEAEVFFSSVHYGVPVSLTTDNFVHEKVIAVAGIANPTSFFNYVNENWQLMETVSFPDHYSYSQEDVIKLTEKLKKEEKVTLLLTEKDAVKWNTEKIQSVIQEYSVFFIPIEMNFIKNGNNFERLLEDSVKKKKA